MGRSAGYCSGSRCVINGQRSDDAEYLPGPPTLLRLGPLQLANVLNYRFAPAIDMRPRSVANAVLGACHVDHVSLALGRGNNIIRLLVGRHDDSIKIVINGELLRPPVPLATSFSRTVPKFHRASKTFFVKSDTQ